MRTARIIGEGTSYYHCMSRVVDRRFILNADEKEQFRKLMRRLEEFSGVRVLTYALMSNHFHLLVEVPTRKEVGERELIRRCEALYGKKGLHAIQEKWRVWEEQMGLKGKALVEADKQKLMGRMYDLSGFVKELKQRFTQWYNRKEGRRGTLWEERFKSILIEGSENALMTMGAYIDLNAVRAGLCEDPKEYRHCGYGEAMGGGQRAREGVRRLMGYGAGVEWAEVAKGYRVHVFGVGGEKGFAPDGTAMRPGITEERVRQVVAMGGELSREELLRCRVRYLADGMVLGSKEFVNGVFRANRIRFGLKRKDGARKLKYGDWGGLCAMRDLRRDVVMAGG